MGDAIYRKLRDGGEEGEYAPALTIKDTLVSPFGLNVFADILAKLSSAILAGNSKSPGVVLVALSRSPSFYVDLLKRKGIDVKSTPKRIHILDCYTDPLGWNDHLPAISCEASFLAAPFKGVRNMDKLFSSIIEGGRELVGPGKNRFCVAIDSANEMLRHASLPSVSGLLNSLRSHEQVSSIFWSLNSDLIEARTTSALEYMSSMTASLEPFCESWNGQKIDLESLCLIQRDFGKGRVNVRLKLRKGRVRVMCEEYQVDQSGISFSPVSSNDAFAVASSSLLPKVQFNLQLSEKERMDKEKVVLPFEHQGYDKPIQIYDGRRSLPEGKNEAAVNSMGKPQTNEVSSGGEIIYFRDSDDEGLDSDEDPDDDLDI